MRVLSCALIFIGLECEPIWGVDDAPRALFDLLVDPHELASVFEDKSYSASVSVMEDRFSWWRNLSITRDLEADVDIRLWTDSGGLVPWVRGSVPPPPKPIRPASTAHPGVPNLVFIMMDDGKNVFETIRFMMLNLAECASADSRPHDVHAPCFDSDAVM